jgi:hypothetical protein
MTVADIVRIEVDTAVARSQQLQGVLRDYLDCAQRLDEWTGHFDDACENLRTLVAPGNQTVVLFGDRQYIVSHSPEGFIEVDELVRRGAV